jgi:hypothetical protein
LKTSPGKGRGWSQKPKKPKKKPKPKTKKTQKGHSSSGRALARLYYWEKIQFIG